MVVALEAAHLTGHKFPIFDLLVFCALSQSDASRRSSTCSAALSHCACSSLLLSSLFFAPVYSATLPFFAVLLIAEAVLSHCAGALFSFSAVLSFVHHFSELALPHPRAFALASKHRSGGASDDSVASDTRAHFSCGPPSWCL